MGNDLVSIKKKLAKGKNQDILYQPSGVLKPFPIRIHQITILSNNSSHQFNVKIIGSKESVDRFVGDLKNCKWNLISINQFKKLQEERQHKILGQQRPIGPISCKAFSGILKAVEEMQSANLIIAIEPIPPFDSQTGNSAQALAIDSAISLWAGASHYFLYNPGPGSDRRSESNSSSIVVSSGKAELVLYRNIDPGIYASDNVSLENVAVACANGLAVDRDSSEPVCSVSANVEAGEPPTYWATEVIGDQNYDSSYTITIGWDKVP